MIEEVNVFAFDQFPHGKLSFRMTRRQFWSTVVTGLWALSEKSDGVEPYSLANLGIWSNEQLAEVIPVIIPGCQISVDEGCIWGHSPSQSAPSRLFPEESPALTAFNQFNGFTSLEEVSAVLRETTGWDQTHSFAYVRGLFLTLVLEGLCYPQNEV
jgi:hypothetical protein